MKQMINEKLKSNSIGIILILTFLAVFIFSLYSQKGRIFLPLIIGAVVLVLTAIHLKILKYSIKKALIFIFLGVVACIIFFMTYLFVFGGQDYFENQPTSYTYTISIQGLGNYSRNFELNDSLKDGWFDFSMQGLSITNIIVPFPMKDGKQIFADEELQNKSFGNWRSTLVITKQGKMLAFQTRDKNLTNIDAGFRKDFNYTVDIKNIMDNALLYPITNDSTANYTVWVYGSKNVQNYTTYIYIDQNIQPVKSDDNIITFNLELTLRGNTVHGRARNYKVDVFEAIPESIKGPIPVKAQLAVLGETGWGPYV